MYFSDKDMCTMNKNAFKITASIFVGFIVLICICIFIDRAGPDDIQAANREEFTLRQAHEYNVGDRMEIYILTDEELGIEYIVIRGRSGSEYADSIAITPRLIEYQ